LPLKDILEADKRAIKRMRDFPKGVLVYREESKEFPSVSVHDMG
jgi:hypothetical protein